MGHGFNRLTKQRTVPYRLTHWFQRELVLRDCQRGPDADGQFGPLHHTAGLDLHLEGERERERESKRERGKEDKLETERKRESKRDRAKEEK
jgi:hypothetical protein